MAEQPGVTAQQKDPRQLGSDLVQALAQLLAHNSRFLDDLHNARPLVFRGTVTALQTTSGVRQVQVQRTGQAQADAYWYPIYDAGYSATVGDDVLLLYVDRRMSACVIGARTGPAHSANLLSPMTSTVAVSDASNKVLSLWNGSSNNAAPSGWPNVGFDDSAWGAAVSSGTASSPALLAGSSSIWSASSPASQTDACLVRKTLVLPAGAIVGATLALNADDKLLGAYVNGTAPAGMAPWDNTGGIGGGLRTAEVTALLLPGQANCIALEVQNNSALPSPNTASVNWALQVTQSAIGAPSDPTLHEGDLIYRHSGSAARLGVGANGQALVSDGTDPLWGQPRPSSLLVLLPNPYHFIDDSATDNGQPPDFIMTAAGDVIGVGGQ